MDEAVNSSHRRRLERVLPQLLHDFEGVRTSDEVRACADAVLLQFADKPVRAFVEVLALKRARECLLRDVCDLLP